MEDMVVDEEEGLSLTTQKVIVLLSIALVTFTSGLVPFKLVDKLRTKTDRAEKAARTRRPVQRKRTLLLQRWRM